MLEYGYLSARSSAGIDSRGVQLNPSVKRCGAARSTSRQRASLLDPPRSPGWAFAGVLAFFGLAAFEQILVLAGSHGRWFGAAIFAIAGVYQLTSFKDVCLRHCRSPMSLLIHYTSFRGPVIDIRVGLHHGLYCVACCWGLMLFWSQSAS
jgi:hypothetical protein